MTKRLLALIMAATLLAPSAYAATKTPTPKATAASTKKATPTKKATIKKKTVKKKAQKKAAPTPSPAPTWPPKGFKSNGEVFAKIPTAKELIGTASNSKILTRQLAQLVDGIPLCEKYSCGAVQVASLNGCAWWEITANLVGKNSPDDNSIRTVGNIRVLVKGTAPKQITTVLLVSQQPLEAHHAVTGIVANCHQNVTSEKIPSSTYTAIIN